MFATVCTNCDATLNAPDSVEGKRVKCKKCGDPFVARRAGEEDDEPSRPTKLAAKTGPPSRKPSKAVRDDDAPRPKKKGKKPPKKKSPVLLFALLGVAALLLLVGGPVLYFFVLKDNTSPTTTASTETGVKGKESPKSGAVNTVGWVDFTDPDGRYRVKFPTLPKSKDLPSVTSAVERTIKSHSAVGQAEVFICAADPVDENVPDDQVFDRFVSQMKQMGEDATFSDTRTLTYQSHAAREMTATSPQKQGAMIFRLIRAGNRLIILSVVGDSVSSDAPRVLAFFESLKIDP